jgi:hypothetical protein
VQTVNLPLRWALILAGSAAYLGLAVPGWGGFTAFFSHGALIALAAVQCALSIAALFAGENVSSGVKERTKHANQAIKQRHKALVAELVRPQI